MSLTGQIGVSFISSSHFILLRVFRVTRTSFPRPALRHDREHKQGPSGVLLPFTLLYHRLWLMAIMMNHIHTFTNRM